MSDSILNEIKHMMGILPDDTSFDGDIIAHINTALGTLNQLGLGLVVGYQITSAQNVWAEFYTDPRLNGVRTFVYLTADLYFNPPDTGFVLAAKERQIAELGYRLNVVADYG